MNTALKIIFLIGIVGVGFGIWLFFNRSLILPTLGPTPAPAPSESPEANMVKVFFGNAELDPANTCNKVFPVTRKITRTTQVGKAALLELLKGPTSQEKQIGFFTSLPEGVTVQSLKIENGVARVDFNNLLEAGVGGSCRVAAIRWQITETLKQFPTVTSVVISIDGRTEDILQP